MMARREQQHAEDLMLQVRKTRYQEVFDGAWRAGAPEPRATRFASMQRETLR